MYLYGTRVAVQRLWDNTFIADCPLTCHCDVTDNSHNKNYKVIIRFAQRWFLPPLNSHLYSEYS